MKYLYYNIFLVTILIFTNMEQAKASSLEESQVTMSLLESLNITRGLSANSVTTMYHDSRGYLWIATYDGLNCYNGHVVTTYKNSLNNTSLPSNRIRTITEDSLGRLWIGTDEGLVVYDYDLDKFIIGEQFGLAGIIRDIEIYDGLI